MDAREHVRLMGERLEQYPHLYLDISWDVIYNAYHRWGEIFIPFFNQTVPTLATTRTSWR